MYDADDITDEPRDDDAALRSVRDLAGLAVEDATGISVGAVFGSLIEAESGLVRYLDLELRALDRHVLVPVGHLRIQEPERQQPRVKLRAALLEELEQIPPFPADVKHVDDPFERALLEAYGRTFHGERYYAHPSYDHSGIFVGEHPVERDGAGDGDGPLMRLSYLPGWKVAGGEADIRQWPLHLEDGTRLDVRDLIVEVAAQKVRYVVVAAPDGDMVRLLPIGFLHVDRAARQVSAQGLMADDLLALPPYDGGGVSREQEERVHAALRRSFSGRRRYQLPDYRQPVNRRERAEQRLHGDI
jgi:hypothetical protein